MLDGYCPITPIFHSSITPILYSFMRNNNIRSFIQSPLKMKMFMLMKLPMGLIAGLRITKMDSSSSVVTVPFKYVNKNPFKSMYFAVLSMAAELSSGIIALSVVSEAEKPISMLVLNMTASFTKKVKSKVIFTCSDGEKIKNTIAQSIVTGEGQTIDVVSVGIDESGDKVAEFCFTWTFKPKNP